MWGFAQIVTILSALVSYPIDTVRKRMMMMSGKNYQDRQYKGTVDCFVKIYKNEGMLSFFNGFLPNTISSTGNALLLVFYDKIKAVLL